MKLAKSQQHEWRKSSYSGRDYNCVECALFSSSAAVRDSKRPEAGQLSFAVSEWSAFLATLKARGV